MTNTTLLARADDARALWDLLAETGGELNETLETWLAEVEKNLAQKVDAYRVTLDDLEAETDRLKARADEFRAASHAVGNVAQHLKDRIKVAMARMGTDEVNGSDYRFKLSKVSPRLVIENESVVPENLKIIKTVYELDKERIKKLLEFGEDVPGVRLEQGFALRSYIQKKK